MMIDMQIDFNGFQLFTSCIHPTFHHQSLMIHGGARSHDIFHTLRSILAEYHVGSISFDCIGHGQSDGQFSDSSLNSRTQQALAILQYINTHIKTCIGVSMGAYNALKLSKLLTLDALVLIVPGVYTPDAYDIPFGTSFRQIIRQTNSWQNSDAWEIIHQFKGKLLIVSVQDDEVIPDEIPLNLFNAATQCQWKHHLIIPNAQHKHILNYIFETPQLKYKFLYYLKKCLSI